VKSVARAIGLLLPRVLAAQSPAPTEPPASSKPAETQPAASAPAATAPAAASAPAPPNKPDEEDDYAATGPGPQQRGLHSFPADNPDRDGFLTPHYEKGFVLIEPKDPDRVPYRLKINHVSQFKYTNSLAVHRTYVDHLGRKKDVSRRNDIQLTRDVFYFSGFVFDKSLDFNILLYTSSATLSATAAGYVGYKFSDRFALRAGFFSLPSLRSMTGTYPFFPGTDRSMATNYMRPGFTQGIWAEGELFPNFRYIAMLGNSLNTLDVKASVIDDSFAAAASVWYDHNLFGPAWDDFEYHSQPALRIGTAFTYAREDRLSDLSTASPENNAIFISDGNLLFETGSLAPDVTVKLASFYLWAVDAGLKYRGLALNAEVSMRWLDHFDADGPLPLGSMFDWAFEASLHYFLVQSRFEPYLRSSYINGSFKDAIEGAVGFRWYPFGTRNVWLDAEGVGIKNSPFGSVLYIYSTGQTGFLVPVQFVLRF
jgi:hypothetical protein